MSGNKFSAGLAVGTSGKSGFGPKEWIGFLLIIGLAIRFGFWFVGEPKAFPDTGTYIDVAKQLFGGDLSNYEGRRTLAYPLLLVVAQFSPNAVWIIQMVAGLVISVCLFYISYELTGNPAVAFLAGMTYDLNLSQLSFEANLIPETQTTLFVASAAVLLTLVHRRFKHGASVPWILLIAAGVLAGSAVMARPQFVFLPVLLGFLVGYGSLIIAESGWVVAFARACVTASPGILMILAWSYFNYVQVGRFSLSTLTGIGLMEHTIAFVELAPERYRTIREVLVQQRDIHFAQTGRHTATWDAVPELERVTGLSLPALDSELLKVSTNLIAEHPLRYAVLVGDAWISFWLVSTPKSFQAIKSAKLANVLAWLWHLEHPLLRSINAIFLVFVIAAMVSNRFREWAEWGFMLTAISAVAFISSALQAFAIGVDNTRYGVTVQALIVLVVITVFYRTFASCSIWQRDRTLSAHTS